MKISKEDIKELIREAMATHPVLQEDGHQDVPSAIRVMKTIIEDAGEMMQSLEQSPPQDGKLPTWWTNKMAVSAAYLNKLRDYLLTGEEPMPEDELDTI